MSSSTSSLVMTLGEASSGGGPQRAGGLERGGGSLDHLLVDSALRQPDCVRDPLGGRAAVCDDDRLANAEQDGAARLVRVDLVAQRAEATADEQAADGRH